MLQRAALGHRVDRVEDEIHQDVPELGGVSVDRRHLVEVGLQKNGTAGGLGLRLPARLAQRDRGPDRLVDVDRREHLRFVLRSAELAEATDQVGGVAPRRPDQLEPPYDLRLVVQLAGRHEQHVAEADDRRHGIAEVVCDAARHLAERPEALLLHDLLLAQLELDELPLEPEDPLRDAEPGVELVGIERLAGEVVRSRPHRLEVVLLPAQRGQEDDVGVPRPVLGADSAAELDAVEIRHHPVGDDQRHVLAVEDRPRLLAVCRRHDVVAELRQDLLENQPGRRVVFSDQDSHRASVGCGATRVSNRSGRLWERCNGGATAIVRNRAPSGRKRAGRGVRADNRLAWRCRFPSLGRPNAAVSAI